MLEPSFAASKNPLAGVVPFHTAPQPRMLASVNMAAEGAGQTSRPTCGFEPRLAHHWRSRMPAWPILGWPAPCARHLEPQNFASGAGRAGCEQMLPAGLRSLRSLARPPNLTCLLAGQVGRAR
jgi:hypothetical protein